MERYFKIDKYNTFTDWDLILTAKDVTPPEPKTNYVDLDGVDGTLDLSEALTGQVVYKDRTVSASFWTDHGKRVDREELLRSIRQVVHGRKVKIVEPDDPDHYFIGRVKIKREVNKIAYAEISIECTCEPYRYRREDSVRRFNVATDQRIDAVFHNTGRKVIIPVITVTGSVTISFNGSDILLAAGNYKIPDLKIVPGVTTIGITGSGLITFTYKEADI